MPKNDETDSLIPQFHIPNGISKSSVASLIFGFIPLVLLAGLIYIWQTQVLLEQKGLYSPFANGLSLIRYLSIIVIMNTCISVSAIKRQALWVYLPLLANYALILLTAYYLYVILHLT